MTLETPSFSISEFELRGYTNPYLSPEQTSAVGEVEDRVNGQLNFLAQMLGWNGLNYWDNLPSTVNQKRQILGGTFGVFNSYVIPRVYEFRNWDNTIVVDRLQFLVPGRQTQVARIVLGDNVYQIQSVEVEGDKYVVSIGTLTDEFFALIAANEPLKIDIPTYRPAPFYRPEVGVSGDYSFLCGSDGSQLVLYPAYDSRKLFPFLSYILFADSVYYFDQPIYFSSTSSLVPEVTPSYDSDRNLWYLRIPAPLGGVGSITGYLAWAHTGATEADNLSREVLIQSWVDPSDWNNFNVLNNFTGTWGNKGGPLPFNFTFDALSLHGFDERVGIYTPPIVREFFFNDIIEYVYSQRATIDRPVPPGNTLGQLWWNNATGVLSMWLPSSSGVGAWVQIDYRESPRRIVAPDVVYPDVTSFRAAASSLPVGTIVRIDNIAGLSVSDNVIGVQGTLSSPASLVLHKNTAGPYWVADEFKYATVAEFEWDALNLPYKVPVVILDATGLAPQSSMYGVQNLKITISGDYEVILMKYYNNKTWEIFPDSVLKYIAFSSLVGGPLQGQLWWDYGNPNSNLRTAAIYYQSAWVDVNGHPQSGPPAPVVNPATILFYANGELLTIGTDNFFDDYNIRYDFDALNGKFVFNYTPRTFVGKVQPPSITISDNLTTTYRADLTNFVFSGLTYRMTPNVYNAETPLRIWKPEALQVAENVNHLAENNYVNALLADYNNGPGEVNWQKYYIRMPLEYGRNGFEWQKVALICQDFGYWGSPIDPELMRCPPEDDLPEVYEELFLYGDPVPDDTYVYSEPYLYSNLAYYMNSDNVPYGNAGIFPATDVQFDEFDEAFIKDYDALHNRQAIVDLEVVEAEIAEVERLMDQAVYYSNNAQIREFAYRLLSLRGKVYGDWVGVYANINPGMPLTGFFTVDLESNGLDLVAPPVWDASIYKFAPTCDTSYKFYEADANNYKICYAYFAADASAAEDPYFDIYQEAAWRYPVTQPKTLYIVPE